MSARNVLAVLSLVALPALAGEVTRWDCAYAPAYGEAVACQLVTAPIEGIAARPLPRGYEKLGPVVRDIHRDPVALDAQTVTIPLHGIPIDMALAAKLAKAVMCAGRPDCEVTFRAERKGLVEATHVGRRPASAAIAASVRRR